MWVSNLSKSKLRMMIKYSTHSVFNKNDSKISDYLPMSPSNRLNKLQCTLPWLSKRPRYKTGTKGFRKKKKLKKNGNLWKQICLRMSLRTCLFCCFFRLDETNFISHARLLRPSPLSERSKPYRTGSDVMWKVSK